MRHARSKRFKMIEGGQAKRPRDLPCGNSGVAGSTTWSDSTIQGIPSIIYVPLVIQPAESVESFLGERELYWVYRCPAFPLVDFSVAISEREPASASMVGTRNITPSADVKPDNEKCIIDRVSLFIQCHPRLGGLRNRSLLNKLAITLIKPSLPVPVVMPVRPAVTEQGIH